MTVPSLIQNTQKQEYVSALKKAYNTLSQAAQMITAEEGSPKRSGDTRGWAFSTQNVYDELKKHLNNMRECDTSSGCWAGNISYKLLNGDNYGIIDDRAGDKRLLAADGTSILIRSTASDACSYNFTGNNNDCAEIYVDVNGAKGPNKWGLDLFWFMLTEDGVIKPAGCSDFSLCNRNSNGFYCACRVITEGKMDY